MERYDYREAMKEDIREYIEEEISNFQINLNEIVNAEDLYEKYYDDMFVSDSITGNASGSYTFSTWKAEENICHNLDLAYDAYVEFGYDGIQFNEYGAEGIDVTIRCYLLGECLYEVCEEIIEELEEE